MPRQKPIQQAAKLDRSSSRLNEHRCLEQQLRFSLFTYVSVSAFVNANMKRSFFFVGFSGKTLSLIMTGRWFMVLVNVVYFKVILPINLKSVDAEQLILFFRVPIVYMKLPFCSHVVFVKMRDRHVFWTTWIHPLIALTGVSPNSRASDKCRSSPLVQSHLSQTQLRIVLIWSIFSVVSLSISEHCRKQYMQVLDE